MGADLSRVRFDARNDHAAVLLQQGRLLLDADWNELVAIVERRLRAEAADLDSPGPVPGIAGVAVVPQTTPDGFKVTLTGGNLSIGRGRMYVDGLLAENHGTGAEEYDEILREVRGAADTPYAAQPYWPDPPVPPSTGTHLAYLDVWQREITNIEDPSRVDPAIGVDTTAALQTVWQVRLHALEGAAVNCSTPDADIPGWAEQIAPSGARLSVDTIEVPDSEDPCQLPPSGGYRGLENQAYRVQVHTGGQPGTATFLWSRDNGSVVFPAVEVLNAGSAVRVSSIGKDAVLRFHDGDWVEFTDDRRELDGRPGELRKVTVKEQDARLEFTPALPADLQMSPADAAKWHLRARRWDQRGQIRSAAGGNLDNLDAANATGAITVPSAPGTGVVLEAGIVVRFDSTGAAFRTGDHWVFAARTADTSVQKLVKAPPLGPQHHYARLGVLSYPDGETDCRTLWPGECACDEGCGDCTVCVTPESHASGALTIQAAVDRVVAEGGGTVCLAVGAYRLNVPVTIEDAVSVTIRGQGLRTLVVSSEGAFRVTRSAYIILQDFSVLAPGLEAVLQLDTTAATTVTRLTIVTSGNADQGGDAITLAGVALLTTIRDNVLLTGTAVRENFEADPVLTAELDISDNLLVCSESGIDLQRDVVHLLGNRVADNTVLRASRVGIRMSGAIAPGQAADVVDNTVVVRGAGIAVGTAGFGVLGNDVTGTAQERGDLPAPGIQVLPAKLGAAVLGATRIDGNRVSDVGGAGISVLAPVSQLELSHNHVQRARYGIQMTERARAEVVVAEGNTVLDVGSRQFDDQAGSVGIQLVGAGRAVVESNTVHGVGTASEIEGPAAGIRVLACQDSRVAGNSVDRIGAPDGGGEDLGIAVQGLIARSQVSNNQSRSGRIDERNPAAFRGLLLGTEGDSREPAADLVGPYVVGNARLATVVGPSAVYFATRVEPEAVVIDTNIVAGGGRAPAAAIGVGGDLVLTGNQLRNPRGMAEALRATAGSMTVNANRVSGGEVSVLLSVAARRFAVLGNITSNGIRVNGTPLAAPWQALNPDGVA